MPSFADPPTREPDVDPLPTWLQAAITRAPLYGNLLKRGWPTHCHEVDDLETVATNMDDPLGGRGDPAQSPVVYSQVAQDLALYWGLDAADLERTALTLADSWRDLGIQSGDRVGFYDYSSSPLVAYASRAFMPHLDRGAADVLTCLPICNDGLPELAERCAHILEYVQPSTLFIEADAVDPLLRVLDKATPRPDRMVVTADDRLVSTDKINEWQQTMGTTVRQMLRCDTALFFAPPCAFDPLTFHPSVTGFRVEAVDLDPADGSPSPGRIAVTNLAVRSSVVVRYLTSFHGVVRSTQCRCGRNGPQVTIL